MSAPTTCAHAAAAVLIAATLCCGASLPVEAQDRTASSAALATLVPRPPQDSSRSSDAAGAEFKRFIASLWPEAKARGVSRATFERAFRGVTVDEEVLGLLDRQPEHTRSAAEYVSQLVSPARIEAGRRKLAELGPLLSRIEAAFGVDRHIVLAIWGVESSFGTAMGGRPVVRSLATLAFGDRRRARYWRGELLTVLVVLERGEVTPEQMVGSWAGAMGHTQFMPASYAAHAVDFDADRRRDIWGSVADALASTASYLKASGWSPDEPWGYEVVLPRGFDYRLTDPRQARSLFEWLEVGVRPPPGRRLMPARHPLRLVLPAGAHGPAFLVTRNFRAILRYNSSTLYALAVGHLADRLAGAPALATPWPANDRALAKAEREEVQERLLALGLDAGEVDGVIGGQTKAAIRVFQHRAGMPADGHAGPALLHALRREPPS